MSEKEIEEAARKFSSGSKMDAEGKIIYQKAFKTGASYAMYKPWIYASVKPKEEKVVLAFSRTTGLVLVCGSNHSNWEDLVKEFSISSYAYIDGIIPPKIK